MLVALTITAATLAVPAQAQTRYWTDTGGSSSMLDIKSVRVANNAKGVRITVRVKRVDFTSTYPYGSYHLAIDTKRSKKGPEFGDGFGIPGDGGFSALKGSKAWRKSWQTYPVAGKCGRSVREKWDLEHGKIVTFIRAKKGCLNHPKRVRVHVSTVVDGEIQADPYMHTPYSSPQWDHFPTAKAYSPWVRYSRK